MKQKTLVMKSIFLSAIVLCGTNALAQSLSADSKTIKSKARTIEQEYSQNMRDDRLRQSSSSGGAIVVEEGFRLPSSQAPIIESAPAGAAPFEAPSTYSAPAESSYQSNPSAMSNSFNYPSNLGMREDRKMGAGLSFGGSKGLVGAHLEFNFEDQNGVVAGFGTGPGYNSIQLAWKHSFEGGFLNPYTTVGYSRWYNSGGRGDNYLESDVLDRVLTSEERATGRFGTDFLNGSLGLQYNQLTGDLAGISVFGELTGMYEVKRSNLIPNGSVGAIYFF